ncbi:kinase-like protein [Rickenella mellea]|uniref:non-specific serine/threonine protein kinase n=1 Tax=Rickenella mellea TaxID=50990 RepID=A0A4Y7PPJ0_9AGAM|nr:kinase-like protein [Rickenella mellea]
MEEIQPTASTSKPADYVYFNRSTDGLSSDIMSRTKLMKMKLESYYNTAIEAAIERNGRRQHIERVLASMPPEAHERELRRHHILESQYLRLRRTKIGLSDFRPLKVIGKGAFGEVRLVQKIDTGKVYALKSLKKDEMIKRGQLAHVRAERDVLAESQSPWVVQLYYSFQDPSNLYLIMEFLPGGDLMTMLIKHDIFPERVTQFYMAECVLAIEAVHDLGFIHRDIKPDNILIDQRGHLKLTDFGLSTGLHKQTDAEYYKKLLEKSNGIVPAKEAARNSTQINPIHLTMSHRNEIATWKANRRKLAFSKVGTPDYIAPEVFFTNGYGKECDWWSIGAIMYECVVGWPPFASEAQAETYKKIIDWPNHLYFPEERHLSRETEDLIRRLLTWVESRLTCDQIKLHPFFQGVDWRKIRYVQAPFVPELKSVMDTSYFPTDELAQVPFELVDPDSASAEKDLAFLGFTFKRFTGVHVAL